MHSVAPAMLQTAAAAHESYWAAAWRRLRRHRLAMLGLGIIGAIVLLAIFAPVVSPQDPLAIDYAHTAAPPGVGGHLLGTDAVGRDILSRLIYGTRISLQVGIVAVVWRVAIRRSDAARLRPPYRRRQQLRDLRANRPRLVFVALAT